MAKKEWRALLNKANKDLKKGGAKLRVFLDADAYDLNIDFKDGETVDYASGYWENELVDLINEAWEYAKGKAEQHDNKQMYLVSIIERGEDEYDFYQNYKLFNNRKDAESYYEKEHKAFLSQFGEYYPWLNTTDCNDSDNHYNTYTWNGGENHYEITIYEIKPE